MPADEQTRARAADARTAARDARRRWADEVSRALDERRLSINAAAKAIAISPGRLQAWLGQDVEPSPRVMGDLAEVIGRSHLYLLQLLDWLPPELAQVPLQLEAESRLRDAIDHMRRWVDAAASTASGTGAADRIARAVLDATGDGEVLLRPSVRGVRHPVRYGIDVGIRHGSTPVAADDLDELVRVASRGTPVRTLTDDELAAHALTGRADVVLSVAELLTSRPAGVRPDLSVPPGIVVVGSPEHGVREVAALLARLLAWAHLDVTDLARASFALPLHAPADVVQRAVTTVAQRLFREAGTTGRFTVWSYGEPDSLLETFREIGPELPLVVVLQPPASAFAADSGRMEAALHVVRGAVAARRDPAGYLFLDVPAPDAPDPDAATDAAVELALAAARWLGDEHGGPRVEDAGTLLGSLAAPHPAL